MLNLVDKPALQVTEEAVLKAIRSFSAGSAEWPNGFRPQHLVDLVQPQESDKRLLTSVTSFLNSLLEGKCHKDFVHILFGGRLFAMNKKSGGIRPIIVGYVWRRLAAKCAIDHAINTLADYLHPSNWMLGFQGAVRPLYTQLGASCPTCQLTTSLQSWISLTLSTVSTGTLC